MSRSNRIKEAYTILDKEYGIRKNNSFKRVFKEEYDGEPLEKVAPDLLRLLRKLGEVEEGDVPVVEGWIRSFIKRYLAHKRAKNIARNLGVPDLWHWFLGKEPNEHVSYGAARVIGDMLEEGIELRFDSRGVWGLSGYDAQIAWFKSGTGKNIQYFKNILIFLSQQERKDGYNLWILPNKYLSISEIDRYFKVMDALYAKGVMVSKRLALRLIKLSYPTRAHAMAQLIAMANNDGRKFKSNYGYQRSPIYGPKAIDWKKLHRPMFRLVDSKIIDKAYQWHWYAKKLGVELPQALTPKILRGLPKPFGLSRKQIKLFAEIVETIDTDAVEHASMTIINTLRIFGSDTNAAKRFLNKIIDRLGEVLTNSEPIDNLDRSELKMLARCLSRDARYVNLASRFSVVVMELGREPKSYEEAVVTASAFEYDNILERNVAIEAAKAGLSQYEFEKTQKRYIKRKPQKAVWLPENVVVKSIGYVVKMLSKDDPRGYFLGELTNCCQSIWSAGGSCAISGMEQDDKGFLVILDGEEILAQSWIWTDRKGHIVLDSIESKGLSKVQMERASKALLAWAKKAVDTIFCDGVYLGKTSYGITKEMRKLLVFDKKLYSLEIKKYKGYIDGEEQYKIL